MKKIIATIVIIVIAYMAYQQFFTKDAASEPETETASNQDANDGWVTLFDGKTFNGWHNYKSDTISKQWTIEGGAMVFTPYTDLQNGRNNIVTDQSYTNFILSLEWKISEGGNSGIFWAIVEDENYAVPYQTGPEIQVLDNLKHPDGKLESHRAGSLYDMIAPSEPAVKPVGEWNTCVIEINHHTNAGKIILNNIEIVNFPVHGEGWNDLIAKSKFKDWPGFGKSQTGKIGLQDHGDIVSYRNIKIKEL